MRLGIVQKITLPGWEEALDEPTLSPSGFSISQGAPEWDFIQTLCVLCDLLWLLLKSHQGVPGHLFRLEDAEEVEQRGRDIGEDAVLHLRFVGVGAGVDELD